MRPSNRLPNQMRTLNFIPNYIVHTPSVFVEWGNTKLVCTASVEDTVPRFLQKKKKGWLTAEYSMLPGATNQRTQREAKRGRQSGRTLEIQRLIGRSLRSMIDLSLVGERTFTIDCDVIQADGGTRTAAITGGCLALVQAINKLLANKQIAADPIRFLVAAVSVGMSNGIPVLDLDYAEDHKAHTDMNIVMNENGQFIEIQGTAEQGVLSRDQLNQMLDLAQEGIKQLIEKQKSLIEQLDTDIN